MALARRVYEEVTSPPEARNEARRRARRARELLESSPLGVLDIPLLSPAAARFAAFRQGRSTDNDAGEAESVALAAFDADLVFVTNDRRAAWLACRELGQRVTTMPWFLRRLVEQGALAVPEADAIAQTDPKLVPHWWSDWVASAER